MLVDHLPDNFVGHDEWIFDVGFSDVMFVVDGDASKKKKKVALHLGHVSCLSITVLCDHVPTFISHCFFINAEVGLQWTTLLIIKKPLLLFHFMSMLILHLFFNGIVFAQHSPPQPYPAPKLSVLCLFAPPAPKPWP